MWQSTTFLITFRVKIVKFQNKIASHLLAKMSLFGNSRGIAIWDMRTMTSRQVWRMKEGRVIEEKEKVGRGDYEQKSTGALTSVAQLVGHHHTKQKVASSIPSQDTCLGLGFDSQLGCV